MVGGIAFPRFPRYSDAELNTKGCSWSWLWLSWWLFASSWLSVHTLTLTISKSIPWPWHFSHPAPATAFYESTSLVELCAVGSHAAKRLIHADETQQLIPWRCQVDNPCNIIQLLLDWLDEGSIVGATLEFYSLDEFGSLKLGLQNHSLRKPQLTSRQRDKAPRYWGPQQSIDIPMHFQAVAESTRGPRMAKGQLSLWPFGQPFPVHERETHSAGQQNAVFS